MYGNTSEAIAVHVAGVFANTYARAIIRLLVLKFSKQVLFIIISNFSLFIIVAVADKSDARPCPE